MADFESAASTNSATPAKGMCARGGAVGGGGASIGRSEESRKHPDAIRRMRLRPFCRVAHLTPTMSQFHGIEMDPQTIRSAAAGDRRAHEASYRNYQRPVYTLVRRLISRPAVADEPFQEVFVEILRSIGGYAGQGSFSGWVRAIAVNKCLVYLRSPWNRGVPWLDADGPDAPLPSAHIIAYESCVPCGSRSSDANAGGTQGLACARTLR
jgi:hypothetical protein